jgi:dTDP-glucose 4,6-dehydratase
MRLIVTGGAGFIGSAVVCRAVRAGHDVLNIDKLTYAGRRDALTEIIASPHHRLLLADVTDGCAMDSAFREFDPDAVLHLAAESHVDRSIDDPAAFLETNVRGTFVLLETALRHWSRMRGARHDAFRFIQVSTDEVFGTLTESAAFDATSRYAPNSPYAASKAAADHFARAWHRTYRLPVIITNCSNNYGPRQHAEKLIPTVIRYALEGAPIPIYGNGRNMRDWLYVEDHVAALMAALQHGKPGGTYLFGGRCEVCNVDLAAMICRLLDARHPRSDGASYAQQITFVTDRPGHDLRYAVDPSHAEAALGWTATERLETGLIKTVDWYGANSDWLVPVTHLGRLGTRVAAPSGLTP